MLGPLGASETRLHRICRGLTCCCLLAMVAVRVPARIVEVAAPMRTCNRLKLRFNRHTRRPPLSSTAQCERT